MDENGRFPPKQGGMRLFNIRLTPQQRAMAQAALDAGFPYIAYRDVQVMENGRLVTRRVPDNRSPSDPLDGTERLVPVPRADGSIPRVGSELPGIFHQRTDGSIINTYQPPAGASNPPLESTAVIQRSYSESNIEGSLRNQADGQVVNVDQSGHLERPLDNAESSGASQSKEGKRLSDSQQGFPK